MARKHDYLRRLPPECYRGQVSVHWSMTIEDRQTGWLRPILYYKFRELLTHTAFRYGFCCPIYCLMPDHIHLLWTGILDSCDQRLAAQHFRQQLNLVLKKLGVGLQHQGYDHVPREKEQNQSVFEEIFAYMARNPERAGLVGPDDFQKYPYTGCLVPGYPELRIWATDFWTRFWRIYDYLRKHELRARIEEGDEG